jgi:hypothetical protein
VSDRWLRPAIAGVTLVAAVTFLLDLAGPFRIVAAVAFVLLCPGVAWARLLRLDDLGDLVGLGVVIGLSLGAVVAQTMALAGWWSPGAGMAVLASITAIGLALPADRRPVITSPE